MLLELRIKNYALIEQSEMKPSSLLNIITGETGAGKSIMLGAIGLLLGNRADTKVLFNADQKCVVEGIFDIAAYQQLQELFEAEDLDFEQTSILRREITPAGKSRAFINDTPVTLETIRRIGSYLMDIHSQHDTLQLGDTAFQLNIIDTYAGNALLREQYGQAYRSYKQLEAEHKQLEQQLAQSQKELDYHTFLLNELAETKLSENEQEELEEQLKQLEHAEEIKLKLTQATLILNESEYNVATLLKDTSHLLGQLCDYAELYRTLKERLDSCSIELNDIADEIATAQDRTEADPQRLDLVQDRLNTIYTLQRKHQVSTIAELLAIQAGLEQKVSSVQNLDEAIARTRKAKDQAYAALEKAAAALSESRQEVFRRFEEEVQGLLTELGMPNARLQIQHSATAPTATGTDVVNLLFSANKGAALQTLSKAASGGEFSRLMLAVKYTLAGKTALPTIIFDEIDTGISGEIAMKVGKLMHQMARRHQLIAISHLPQIAAQGDAHFFVYKQDRADRTVSSIKKLSNDERITEIAHMIAGANPSTTAYQNAKELLSMN